MGCYPVPSHYQSQCRSIVNTLRPRQHGRHFADDTFKRIFLNENVIISMKISLKFVPKDPFNNIPALVQIMAWRRPGDKPLSEAMMVSLLTHICVTQPRWVNRTNRSKCQWHLKHLLSLSNMLSASVFSNLGYECFKFDLNIAATRVIDKTRLGYLW